MKCDSLKLSVLLRHFKHNYLIGRKKIQLVEFVENKIPRNLPRLLHKSSFFFSNTQFTRILFPYYIIQLRSPLKPDHFPTIYYSYFPACFYSISENLHQTTRCFPIIRGDRGEYLMTAVSCRNMIVFESLAVLIFLERQSMLRARGCVIRLGNNRQRKLIYGKWNRINVCGHKLYRSGLD